jgi:hypothetical protein
VVDRLTELAWITRAVHSDGDPGDPPPPTPRPGDQPDVADDPRRMSTTDEIKAFFGGADGAGAGFAIRFTPTDPPADETDPPDDQPAEPVPPQLPGQVLGLDGEQKPGAGH